MTRLVAGLQQLMRRAPYRPTGHIVLSASAPQAGRAWTDDGTAGQERGLKHRADNDTRINPIQPGLVRLLRTHIKGVGTTPDGRIFQTARGGILQDSGYNEVWNQARKTALTPAQYRSPRGRRPYDLRHAAVSLWLNSGVPATEGAAELRSGQAFVGVGGHGVALESGQVLGDPLVVGAEAGVVDVQLGEVAVGLR